MTNGRIIEGHTENSGCSDLSPATSFFHVPVLDEVFAESRLGNPDEQVSVEKHKKHNRPMGHLKPSEGRDLVAWKSFCQSVPNTPMNVGESWATIGRAAKLPNGSMRVFHGAGTTEEENAGQRRYTDERRAETQHTATSRSGGGNGLWPAAAPLQTLPHCRRNLGNPCAEKGMHTRTQHFFTFGSGDCSFANASEGFKGWGADEVAPPRS